MSLSSGLGLGEILRQILVRYPSPKQIGKDREYYKINDDPDLHELIKQESKQAVSEILEQRDQQYNIDPSLGQGSMSDIPYIPIERPDETTTTQKGIYIVYLFDTDADRLYLTLNQGATEAQRCSSRISGKPYANTILKRHASQYRQQLPTPDGFQPTAAKITSTIDYDGTEEDVNRADAYNSGAIFTKSYAPEDLQDEDQVKADLLTLVDTYETLLEELYTRPQYDLQERNVWCVSPVTEQHWGTWQEQSIASISSPGFAADDVQSGDLVIAGTTIMKIDVPFSIGRITTPQITREELEGPLNETASETLADEQLVGVDWYPFGDEGIAINCLSNETNLFEAIPDDTPTQPEIGQLPAELGHFLSSAVRRLVTTELATDFETELDQIESHLQLSNNVFEDPNQSATTEQKYDERLIDDPDTGEADLQPDPLTEDDLESPDHPLVTRALDDDSTVYKFTAPPDYWLTAFEYTALSFQPDDKDRWNQITPGDIILFHSRQDPSWDELSSRDSALLGAGIVHSRTTKPDEEAWWYDEHEGGPKGDSFPYLITFGRLFATGRLDEIDTSTQITEKDSTTVDAELEALLTDALAFDRADTLCRRVSETGFPRHRILGSLSTANDLDRGTVLLDALTDSLEEVPAVALKKEFTGTIDIDEILEGLHFPDNQGEEIVVQIEVALRSGKHTILTGPPGTGKTELARRICTYLADEYSYLFSGSQVTTATADWSTFDTVGGYMPQAESETAGSLEFSPGLILNRFKDRHENYQRNEPLVIDELNRADIDKAFGQLFTVLSGQAVQLPYTRDEAEIELTPAATATGTPAPYQYVIPESWSLFATLNTYDKTSLYEMSYAFMRRFAFIRVPAPELPDDNDSLKEFMQEYARIWNLSPDSNALLAVGQVWRATNEAVEDRAIGPAVVKDILEYVEAHSTVSREKRLTQAVISFIFPQLEGVPKRERIIKEIAAVSDTDTDELDRAARDMLQVTITTDE